MTAGSPTIEPDPNPTTEQMLSEYDSFVPKRHKINLSKGYTSPALRMKSVFEHAICPENAS